MTNPGLFSRNKPLFSLIPTLHTGFIPPDCISFAFYDFIFIFFKKGLVFFFFLPSLVKKKKGTRILNDVKFLLVGHVVLLLQNY